MNLHWRNISNETGIENHLEVKVSNSEKPAIRLIAGTNLQFKIVKDSNDLLWGRIASDYYGCWALRGKNNWAVDEMPIPPITSSTVEESKSQLSKDRIGFWAKYFLNELKISKSSILFDGTWELTEAKKNETATNHKNLRKVDYDFTINDQQPVWMDWDFGNALKVIRLKEKQPTETGRIKWWKKKVAEDSCPPILTWFVASLDSLVVVDGHDRLSAYEALNIQPQFLIINSVRKEPKEVDKGKQQGILDSLAKRNLNPEKKGLTVERLNYLLLDAFDDSAFRRPITKSNGKAGLSESWIKEVSSFKLDSSIDQEELEAMLVGD
ncbi:MAG: hypothetical protein MJA30_01465 [Cytophagales bacterium]|nr:hypothetical protein [Cytophagales bacterium]